MQNGCSKANDYQRPAKASTNGATVAGFLLFITGGLLMLMALIDIFVHLRDFKTALALVGGLFLYKAGQVILNHYATLRKRPERRRQLF